jgi:hypothetical protein
LIPEASGIAASRRNPGVWWLLDDGRTVAVWAISDTGSTLGRVVMDGFRGRDNEDLAVGPCPEGTCVYVADIGDNRGTRDEVRVARFAEPDLTRGVPSAPAPTAVAHLRYPDGPLDAEALLVDAAGVPLVVTKGGSLFAAPGFADGTLVALGHVPLGPAVGGLLGAMVTAADSRPGRVVLRTYDSVVEFTAPSEDAPLAEFPTWQLASVPSPVEPQSESIAYTPDGHGYVTLSEGDPRIWMVRKASR